jgi:outer membrane protein insertion porin family
MEKNPEFRVRGQNTSFMHKPFLGKLFSLLLLGALLGPGEARGQEILRVAILPLRIYAADREKMKDWPARVEGVLSREMKKDEQILVVEEDKVRAALKEVEGREMDESLAREIGKKVDADYVVLGSITRIDSTVSLDLRVLDVLQKEAMTSVFKTGKTPEDLLSLAREASREINLKILKKEIITKVLIEGNKAIEESAIRAQIKSREGEIFSPTLIREDLKKLYQMGYFQNIRVEKRDWGRGKAVVFVVEEKPVIREIKFSGNKNIKTSELQEVMDLKPRTVLNLNTIKENVNKILKKYREEAYFLAEVHYELETPRPGEVIVHFKIKENKKIRIKKITFTGNAHYSDDILKKNLPETKEAGFFSWVTKSGVYKEEILEKDSDAIMAFYLLKGFLEVKVAKPKVEVAKDGITITIPVEEGRQFKIGRVDLKGDLIAPKTELFKLVPMYPGEIFNREKLRQSISNLTDRYADQGYAFVDVSPQIIPHEGQSLVDVVFDVHRGSKVHFERVNIQGNTKTRDRVIRRDMEAVEGELYSLSAIKKSRDNLNYLGFFKEVDVTTKKGSADDKMVVNVRVEEAPTGSISAGVGYSSIDKLVTILSLSQNNLFGRGQRLVLSGQFGSISRYYNLSFTEPRLFDTQILAGGDLYNIYRDYDDYSIRRSGGVARFGFPLFEYFRLYTQYLYEKVDTYNILDTASDIIKSQAGLSTTSSIYLGIRRDTRDNRYDPTKGTDHVASVTYAGRFLGGSNDFTKYQASSAWFITPFWNLTFSARGLIGYIEGNPIPLYERFLLGGIYSVRGFKTYSIGPKAPNGEVIGGDKELLFNFEMVFPIAKEIKLKGLIFFDAGNAWDVAQPYQLDDLRTSAGFGFRWMSPFGPLRLEWGYNLKPREGESQSAWDFTMGTFF